MHPVSYPLDIYESIIAHLLDEHSIAQLAMTDKFARVNLTCHWEHDVIPIACTPACADCKHPFFTRFCGNLGCEKYVCARCASDVFTRESNTRRHLCKKCAEEPIVLLTEI